jgi:hypothetical protein
MGPGLVNQLDYSPHGTSSGAEDPPFSGKLDVLHFPPLWVLVIVHMGSTPAQRSGYEWQPVRMVMEEWFAGIR